MRIERAILDYPVPDTFVDIEHWQAVDDDGRKVAAGGLLSWNDRRWCYFNVFADLPPKQGFQIVRALRRRLIEAGGPIYVMNDAVQFDTAERLDTVLGMKPTDEWIEGKRVWLWQG